MIYNIIHSIYHSIGNLYLYLILGFLILCIYYIIIRTKFNLQKTAKRKDDVYVPTEPPGGLPVECLSYIDNMGFGYNIISSALISLAIDGYLFIKQVGKKFSFQKNDQLDSNDLQKLSSIKINVYSAFVDGGDSAAYLLDNLAWDVSLNFAPIYFNMKIVYILISIAITAIATLPAIIDVFGAAGVMIDLFILAIILITPVISKKYFKYIFVILTSATSIFAIVNVLPGEVNITNFFVIIMLFLFFLINFLFCYFLKKPSKEGAMIIAEIDKFKKYLSGENKEQKPELNSKTYEKYLPYAIALNLAEMWYKKYKGVIETDGNYTPEWVGKDVSPIAVSKFAIKYIFREQMRRGS